ncbi:alpha/beta hydrolase family protein [Paenibacillus oceani]|uniref:Acetylxylan esterase n=1 Tax=Paenibacillus oceani TaxID=2772510 RepID=A0A927H389_9BACL|nr:alpha/beta hydrolase family protein [Paenibacillus oceani]MBD2866087.1 acetylxylan esterase [Paenibacillus oceani]
MTDSILFATDKYMANLDDSVVRTFDYKQALDGGDWTQWQRSFRKQLSSLTGLTEIREQNLHLPLSPRVVEVQSFPGYRREKIYIATEPGIEIPFYLLLPTEGEGPFPLVLTPHGHLRKGKEIYAGNYINPEEREEHLASEADIALQAVAEGYATICMDVRGFWEMSRVEEFSNNWVCSCNELQKRAFMYGRTLIGERVHDMGRLIDYAATRTEIDTEKITITGFSGGGTVSLFTAALDERISVCVPGAYFCTFAGSIMNVPHCLCNFIPGIMKLGEMYDIAGLIAPRPLLIVNGVDDPIFPIEHTREAFAHTRAIYEAIAPSHPDRCELYEGNGGHRYFKERVWPFVRQSNRTEE